MTTVEHLEHPPITEALIDIQVELPRGVVVEQFDSLKSSLATSYPEVKERRQFEGRLEIKGGQAETQALDKGVDGYIFKTEDSVQLAQFRLDGFTLNRLKPYESWEVLFDEAKNLWEMYRNLANPIKIKRLATRYINHLPIPLEANEIQNFLTAPPVIPPGVPSEVSKFLTRVTITDGDSGAFAHITQALDRIIPPKTLNIILDIDAYKEVSLAPDDERVWQELATLRELKNRIFFCSITDATKELFV